MGSVYIDHAEIHLAVHMCQERASEGVGFAEFKTQRLSYLQLAWARCLWTLVTESRAHESGLMIDQVMRPCAPSISFSVAGG